MTNKLLTTIISVLLIGLFSTIVFGQSNPTDSKLTEEETKPTLIGKWKSSEAKVEFINKNSMTINGQKYRYTVVGKVIIVQSDEGEADFPFELKGDKLTVHLSDRTVVYTRYTNDEEIKEETVTPSNQQDSEGSVPQELVGKWCYQSNVNANDGGRMSNICFTLYENGTYEYYGETSSSNPYGGSSSQESDAGRWSATATTLIARSNSGQTRTFTLEKRNHPKTGDPMLIVDGDAFVSYYQKQPW